MEYKERVAKRRKAACPRKGKLARQAEITMGRERENREKLRSGVRVSTTLEVTIYSDIINP